MKKNEIREYLLNNEDVLLEVVSELNSWNGCLENLDFWENDEEFFNTFFDNPMEAIRATYYGNYNYNDEYVKFNGYGNVDSYSEYERIEEIKDNIDDIVENLVECYYNIYINEELENLILELLEEEDDEEEEEEEE